MQQFLVAKKYNILTNEHCAADIAIKAGAANNDKKRPSAE